MFSNKLKQKFFWMVASVATLGVVAHSIDLSSVVNAQDSVSFSGMGKTFQASLYQRWFSEYNKQNSGVQISYQSVDSDANINKYLEETKMPLKDLEYGLEDSFLNSTEVMFGLLNRCEIESIDSNKQKLELRLEKTLVNLGLKDILARHGIPQSLLSRAETSVSLGLCCPCCKPGSKRRCCVRP